MGGGGGYDLGIALSASTSATSGGTVTHAANNAGGSAVQKWLPTVLIVALFLAAVTIILRKH